VPIGHHRGDERRVMRDDHRATRELDRSERLDARCRGSTSSRSAIRNTTAPTVESASTNACYTDEDPEATCRFRTRTHR
jgi:hypothetical protein